MPHFTQTSPGVDPAGSAKATAAAFDGAAGRCGLALEAGLWGFHSAAWSRFLKPDFSLFFCSKRCFWCSVVFVHLLCRCCWLCSLVFFQMVDVGRSWSILFVGHVFASCHLDIAIIWGIYWDYECLSNDRSNSRLGAIIGIFQEARALGGAWVARAEPIRGLIGGEKPCGPARCSWSTDTIWLWLTVCYGKSPCYYHLFLLAIYTMANC